LYDIGELIVYPLHGAGIIRDIAEKNIFGKMQQYYLMEILTEGMEILIPVDRADEIGIRRVADKAMTKEVWRIMSEPIGKINQNWNKRYQENMEVLKTGDLLKATIVLKDLLWMDKQKGLSGGEKRMLSAAKNVVCSELLLVEKTDQKTILDKMQTLLFSEEEPIT